MRTKTHSASSIVELIDAVAGLVETDPARALAQADWVLDSLTPDSAGALRAQALRARGLALHFQGRHPEAHADLAEAMRLAPLSDHTLRLSIWRVMAHGHHLTGAHGEELRCAMLAVEAARDSGLGTLMAEAQHCLANANRHCGQLQAAIDGYRRVLQCKPATLPLPRRIVVGANLAVALLEAGRTEESLDQLRHCLDQAATQGDLALRSSLLGYKGDALFALSRWEEAATALNESAAHLQACGRAAHEAVVRLKLGQVQAQMGHVAAAEASMTRSLQLCIDGNLREQQFHTHQALAELHKSTGAFEQAVHHLECAHRIERSIFNDQSQHDLNLLRVRLELSEAEHKAAMYQLQHVELAKAHAALLLASQDKDRLLAQLATLSRTDSLTGLSNRRDLDEQLAVEWARARRHNQPVALAMCDLDNFKTINDVYGHSMGDSVLRAVGRILRTRCRAMDLVARFGGEEFCIVFPQTDRATAIKVCQALRQAVADHDWHTIHPELRVTVSIGVTDDTNLQHAERMLAEADRHLYKAKSEGKNRVHWSTPQPETVAADVMAKAKSGKKVPQATKKIGLKP